MPLQKNIALWLGVMMSCAVFGQSVVGKYGKHCSHCVEIEIRKDSTFTQMNYLYYTKMQGKWELKADTLFLNSHKIYQLKNNGKTTLQYKNSYSNRTARYFSKFLFKQDTLIQIADTSSGLKGMITLSKKK